MKRKNPDHHHRTQASRSPPPSPLPPLSHHSNTQIEGRELDLPDKWYRNLKIENPSSAMIHNPSSTTLPPATIYRCVAPELNSSQGFGSWPETSFQAPPREIEFKGDDISVFELSDPSSFSPCHPHHRHLDPLLLPKKLKTELQCSKKFEDDVDGVEVELTVGLVLDWRPAIW